MAKRAFGSQSIYGFFDDTTAFLMLPVDQVNHPAVIARHPNFISVNAALEVDLFGQACAESISTQHISDTSRQADYVWGAIRPEDGKSFIAFPSTARGECVSRITSILTPELWLPLARTMRITSSWNLILQSTHSIFFKAVLNSKKSLLKVVADSF